jgi:CubicO group peptidase (beta-lactamase class C family)
MRDNAGVRYLWIALFSIRVFAQDFTAVEESARKELARLHVPGASIALVRGDRVVYTKAVGVANVETNEPVHSDMVFRLGSTTKVFTAASLAGLSVEGRIDLEAPIGKYIGGLPPQLSQITANQLLSHTAGIRDEAPMCGSHDDAALGAGIRGWTDDWLFTSPGRIFSYSNPGYWLAGYLVEVLSGKAYADAMDARLFQPLGMRHTTLRPLVAMTWPMAQGHEVRGTLPPQVARPAADNAASWPAGSIFSNVNDLARFVIAFLGDGTLEGKRVIDPKVIALLSTPHSRPPDSKESYGYGLSIREDRGVHLLEHSGARMGYGSFIRMAPEERVAVIVETNRTGANLPETVQKAMELLVSMKPRAEPSAPRALAILPQDITRHVGVYRNGDQSVGIVGRDGKLFLKAASGAEAVLVKRSESRYEAEGGGEYVMTTGADGRTEYVTTGGRSLARTRG